MALFERPVPTLGTERDVLGRRIGAFLIDLVLYLLIFGPISGFLFARPGRILGSLGFLGLLVFVLYTFYFEAAYGQTIGKKAMGVVVVTVDGSPMSYRESALRNGLRIIDGLPGLLHLVGLLLVLVTDRRQRLGDLVADTIVVRAKETRTRL